MMDQTLYTRRLVHYSYIATKEMDKKQQQWNTQEEEKI